MIQTLLYQNASSKQQLLRLIQVRFVYILGQLLVLAIAYQFFNFVVPTPPIALILLVEVFACTYSIYQLRKLSSVSELVFLMQLLFDLSAIGALLYFTGGATNAFVSLLLLPVTLGALICRALYAWAIGCYAILIYSILLIPLIPLDGMGSMEGHHHSMNLHYVGMWLTFLISTLLILYFVNKLSAALATKYKELASFKEQQLRNEQVIALGLLSANAAHQLATPLASIKMICEELSEQNSEDELIELMEQQVDRCQNILQRLKHKVNDPSPDDGQSIAISDFIELLKEQWLISYPDHQLAISNSMSPHTLVTSDASLLPAVINLLDNAARANKKANINQTAMSINEQDNFVYLTFTNSASSVSNFVAEELGKRPLLSTEGGMGIGFLLANSSIERVRGEVWLESDKSHIKTAIKLPKAGQDDK
ncbi:histidine kinase dimerization/phospho-acceptor domain-containing protein [Pleionea sp. CnH1-48]|uniref:histidine kinase dimerization/phospho-acceptor domain-containing protein n=1 Tax=Pleionea sp. CnH1-48 TaxID=2954494 RepID=UPI00209768BA|nr:histidine kinase dimerization/phospho-acceptor domain-containing protein [Pleionea sp. CnH1-48]MCO7224848.1 hypothetical protein [Pleionea sp. CnH1-48]